MLSQFAKSKIQTYNRIYSAVYMIFMKNSENTTLLHRWCNTESPIYKNTCNWERKLDIAQLDNCYIGISTKKQ